MTTPIYDPNIPQFTSDQLADSQPQIQVNFQTLFNIFKINHNSLTSASNPGIHTIVELLEQINSIQTEVGEINLYTKVISDDPNSLRDELVIRTQGNGIEINYVPYQIYATDSKTDFFTFIPGRFIVYFGLFTKLPKNILTLNPGIAKAIVSVTFGRTSVSFNDVRNFGVLPWVDILPAENGYFTKIQVNLNKENVLPFYYIVIANI